MIFLDISVPKIIFIYPGGNEKSVEATIGLSILEIAKQNNIDIEGACGGGLACATCHVIVKETEMFNNLPKATEEEEDMLDLAFGLETNSRLCCQIIVTKECDGLKLIIPAATCNLA